MNSTDNPLIPQGSFLDQKNRGRARVKIAVFVVLAIHGIGLMALLMQGCKPSTSTNGSTTATNDMPDFVQTNQPTLSATQLTDYTGGVGALSNTTSIPQDLSTIPTNTSVPIDNVVAEPSIPIPPVSTQITEYKIAKGDTLSAIAKRNNVSLRALQDANPGIDPSKLKIDQTIRIPAPSTTTAVAQNGAIPETNGKAYKVQSGDTLSKIASRFGTTVKAIRKENNLKTERILVGQTLKIPAKTTTNVTAAPPGN